MMSNRERLLVRMVKHGATKVTMRELAEKAQLVWRIGAGEEVSTTCVHLEEWMASAARSCRSALDVMKRMDSADGPKDPHLLTADLKNMWRTLARPSVRSTTVSSKRSLGSGLITATR